MITQDQIKQLAKKYKFNESIVAREFVQLVFLKEMYKKPFAKDIFFKGGTAIRLLYQGNRFSEDLDFTALFQGEELDGYLQKWFVSLKNQYPFNFKARKTLTGKTYLLTATIPFFKHGVFVKLDFSLRENVLQPVKNILETEYPVIFQDFIYALSKDELIAEKIRAVMKRKKHRDLYDLWILQELGGQIDKQLVVEKMRYYGESFDPDDLLVRLSGFSASEFVKDLRPFVPVNERDKLKDLFEYVMAYLHKQLEQI